MVRCKPTRELVNGRSHMLVVTNDGKRGIGLKKFRHESVSSGRWLETKVGLFFLPDCNFYLRDPEEDDEVTLSPP